MQSGPPKPNELSILMNRKLKNEELGRLTDKQFRAADKTPIVLVLDDVRSLNNIGSVFRTADAFCLEGIHLCGITGRPPHRDIQKTALGATETVRWRYHENITDAIALLKGEGATVISVEQTEGSVSLADLELHHGSIIALIFGNEVNGVSQIAIEASDTCIDIPQFGTKHSLNISVSVGIVVWEVVRRMRL